MNIQEGAVLPAQAQLWRYGERKCLKVWESSYVNIEDQKALNMTGKASVSQ